MIVIDASALTEALLNEGTTGDRCRASLPERGRTLAPEHLRSETFQAIRGRYLGRKITLEKAEAAIAALAELRVVTPRRPTRLFPRMWELRHNLTAYDAAYVALAEARGCLLVTADARLAAAPGLRCEIRLAAAA